MPIVIVTGVSGSGKSVVGELLAKRLGWPFCEGDDLHPARNVAKMMRGDPLDDRDRRPWLDAVARWISGHRVGVVACSALKRRYRERLSMACDVRFVLLDPPRAVVRQRLAARRGHFMPASLLDSQMATLERPARTRTVLTLSGRTSPAAAAERIARWVAR